MKNLEQRDVVDSSVFGDRTQGTALHRVVEVEHELSRYLGGWVGGVPIWPRRGGEFSGC